MLATLAVVGGLAAPFGIAVGLRVLGGIVVLALARPDTASASRIRRGGTDMAGPVNRFSQLAAAALVLAGVAGTVMAVFVMDRFADLWSTGWGRLLIAKVALVAMAVVLGARNRWLHMPALAHSPDEHAQRHAHQRLRRAVSIEAAILVCVGVVTAFLVGASAL